MSVKISENRKLLKEMNIKLGDRIRTIRKTNDGIRCGMSTEQLGDKVGVSYNQICNYETGKNYISFVRAILIAHALNRPVKDLYQGLFDDNESLYEDK